MSENNNAWIYENFAVMRHVLGNHKRHGLKQDKMIAKLARQVKGQDAKIALLLTLMCVSVHLTGKALEVCHKQIEDLRKELEEFKCDMTMKGE